VLKPIGDQESIIFVEVAVVEHEEKFTAIRAKATTERTSLHVSNADS